MIWLFSKVTRSFVAIELLTFINNENFRFYSSRELLVFWLNKLYSLSRKESIKKMFRTLIKIKFLNVLIFDFFHRGGITKHNMLIFHKKYLISQFVELSHLSSFIIFSFYSTRLHHGRGNWPFFKNNRSKLSTSSLKKPVLSSSAAHTSSANNFARTSISSKLDNKDIITNHKRITPQI